jgi:hypothetical protein
MFDANLRERGREKRGSLNVIYLVENKSERWLLDGARWWCGVEQGFSKGMSRKKMIVLKLQNFDEK